MRIQLNLYIIALYLASFFLYYSCTEIPQSAVIDAPAKNILLMTTSDFSTGHISVLELDTHKVYKDILPAHSDSLVKYSGNMYFILNRLGEDNITRIDPNNKWQVLYEKSTGKKSNPYDIAVISEDTAIMSLFGKDYIIVINPKTGKIIKEINVSKFADNDNIPEISALFYYDNYIYAVAGRLNRNITGNSIWPPVGESYLLKISTTTFEVEANMILPFSNPLSKMRYSSSRQTIYFAASAMFATKYSLDGGVVEFHLPSQTFLESPLTEEQAGFEITDAILIYDNLGFILGLDDENNSYFAAFDPQQKTLIKKIAKINYFSGGYFTDMVADSFYNIYLADRTAKNPGIRIFDSDTLKEITDKPIRVGLPPYSLEIIE
jgi:hypothetical protein